MSVSAIEKPNSDKDVLALVAQAGADKKTIEIIGGGTKRQIGQPNSCDIQLLSSGLSGIVDYKPSELVMSAKAGTSLDEINQHLDEHGQMLAFEPPDYGALLGQDAGATIGGIFATNLSGSRRLSVGAARDALLGVRFVNGQAQMIKTGGKVMKNVTGLDLVKLMAGSWGTLGFMTDVTFKVLPKPETTTTLLLQGLSDEAAAKAMAHAMAQTVEVASCAHLPKDVAQPMAIKGVSDAITCFRLEGLAPSVAIRSDKLKSHLADFGDISVLSAKASQTLWSDIAAVKPFHACEDEPGNEGKVLWKISVPPMAGYALVSQIASQTHLRAFYDWQGGLVWLCLQNGAHGDFVRMVAKQLGGYATLICADDHTRQTIATFEPQPKPVAALKARIKSKLDPKSIFNPDRMRFNPSPVERLAV